MGSLKSYIWCTLLLLLVELQLCAQSLSFENFSIENGLSVSQILCLYQHTDGEVWMGTHPGGINKYDGHKFTAFTQKDGLSGNSIYSIVRDAQGAVFIGTSTGISVLINGAITTYSEVEGLPSNLVFKVFVDSKGKVWLGTGNGVCTLEDSVVNMFTDIPALENTSVMNIYEDSQGVMWFATISNGVYKYDGSSFKNYSFRNAVVDNSVFGLMEISPGKYWFCNKRGLYELDGETVRKVEVSGHDNVDYYAIMKDSKGNIWLGSNDGAVVFKNNNFQIIRKANGLVNDNIWSIMEDDEGNMWYASSTNGLSKRRSGAHLLYTSFDGLGSNSVNAIQTADGGVGYLATDGGVNRYFHDKNGLLVIDTNWRFVSPHRVLSLALIDDELWVGTIYGIFHLHDGIETKYNAEKRGMEVCYKIFKDSRGTIWVGTADGFAQIQDGIIRKYKPEENTNCIIFDIYEDLHGTMWFASDKGLMNIENGALRLFGEKDGIIKDRIRGILPTEDGELWISSNQGIYHYAGHKFTRFSTDDGLSTSTIYSIVFDQNGYLWAGLPNGIHRLKIEKDKITEIKYFDTNDGFSGQECLNGAISADDFDNVLFGTSKGLSVVKLNHVVEQGRPPKLRITQVKLFSQSDNWHLYADSVDLNGIPVNFELPYHKNHLTFDFIGINMTAPRKVSYRYQLKGFDKEWIYTSYPEVVYSNLSPGEYEFNVVAEHEDVALASDPRIVKFKILPPFWNTWWFYMLSFVLTCTAVFSYFEIRSANKKIQVQKIYIERKNENLNVAFGKLEEQSAELEKKNDLLEQQTVFLAELVAKEGDARQVAEDAKLLLEVRNKDITDSINYAKQIQDAILTSPGFWSRTFKDHFVLYRPKDIVSGDFYWAHEMDDGKKLWVAADCTGHGVPGAFMSMIGNSLLNEVVIENNVTDVDQILYLLRDGIIKALGQVGKPGEQRDGMDMTICMWDQELNVVEFAGANNSMLMIRNNELIEYKADKMPIGYYTGDFKRFTKHVVPVLKSDCIYTHSDGYQDQFGGEKGKKMKMKKVKELLLEINHLPMPKQQMILEMNLDKWMGNRHPQIDDICFIGVRIV